MGPEVHQASSELFKSNASAVRWAREPCGPAVVGGAGGACVLPVCRCSLIKHTLQTS